MRLLWGVLGLLLLALPAGADTIYDVTGTVSFFGNDVCSGQCVETMNFTFQLDDGFVAGQGWIMSLLPGAVGTVWGPLPLESWAPFTTPLVLPDVDGGYIGWGDAGGDSFAITTLCSGHGFGPCTPDIAQGVVFVCGTAACAADFCVPGLEVACPGFAGGGGIGVPNSISATVSDPMQTPEPAESGLTLLGLAGLLAMVRFRRVGTNVS